MNERKIKRDAAVVAAYAAKYQNWLDIKVGESVKSGIGGYLVVVNYVDGLIINPEIGIKDQPRSDEICYVDEDDNITIFSTTEELARALDEKLGRSKIDRYLIKQNVAAIVFLIALFSVIIASFFPNFNSTGFTILGNLVGVAAGFFFGSNKDAT